MDRRQGELHQFFAAKPKEASENDYTTINRAAVAFS